MTKKTIMVDMSATLIHHGHIRLLKKASELGEVIVALTSDESILKHKGYTPELNFSQRKEVVESIKFVDKVVKSPWIITEDFLNAHDANYLVHGSDNKNPIPKAKLILFPRTEGISSEVIRGKVVLTKIGKR